MKITKFLYFLSGIGVGSGVTYFVTRKILDKKYDEMLKIEVDELKEYYNRTQNVISVVKDLPTEKKEGVCDQNGPKDGKDRSKIGGNLTEKSGKAMSSLTEDDYFSNKNRGKRTAYNSYFNPDEVEMETTFALDPGGPTDDDPDEDKYEENVDNTDFYDETDKISGGRMSKTGIELISSVDYNERNNYEKEELFYYKKTKTLADTNDEIVEDSEDVVGSEFEDIIFQGNAGTVYVRNNGFAKDFLITVLNERYDFSRL